MSRRERIFVAVIRNDKTGEEKYLKSSASYYKPDCKQWSESWKPTILHEGFKVVRIACIDPIQL